jgi:hypothetical protein
MKIEVIATTITCRITIREIIDLKWNTLPFLRNEISDATYGVNLYSGPLFGELSSETMDIDFNGVRSDIAGKPEDMILNLLL